MSRGDARLILTSRLLGSSKAYYCFSCGKDVRDHPVVYSSQSANGRKYRCMKCAIRLNLADEKEVEARLIEGRKFDRKVRKAYETSRVSRLILSTQFHHLQRNFECAECGNDVREYPVTLHTKIVTYVGPLSVMCMKCALRLGLVDKKEVEALIKGLH